MMVKNINFFKVKQIMPKMNHFLLASSGVQPDIFTRFFLVMMMNRFLRGSPYFRRYLQPQRQDYQVLVMLQRIIYSDSHFVDPEFRLLLMSQFGLTIFLMNALMCPGARFFFYGIDRVKRGFLSPPQKIQHAITMLSNPYFQNPPFHLSFSIKGFSNWDKHFRFNLMKGVLLSSPSDFAELPEFLALVRHLIVAENPFWESLVDVFICYYLDNGLNPDDEERCPDALQKLLTKIDSSPGSQDLQEFARLFKPVEHGQVIFPNDCEYFLEVIKRFVTYMIESLPSLPGIRFENDEIDFSPTTQLSPAGIELSARIWQILRMIHSLKIPEELINRLRDKNFEDSEQCIAYRVVYRGFEILLSMLKLIQESNGVIYTYIHAFILIQTSTEPHKIPGLCALRDLFTTVTFLVDDENSDSSKYDDKACMLYCYLLRENRDDFEIFLLKCLLQPDFLQTLEVLLLCLDDFDLEDFAEVFMDNSEFVGLFRRYIQENSRTWSRA